MAATFEVHRSFALEDRSLFGLAGVIVEGTVRIGMHAALEDDEEEFGARVHSVEYLDETEDGDGRKPALLFSYSRPEKLRRWQEMDWESRRLTLSWRPD